MAVWNQKGVIFNRKGEEGGFTWNSRNYIKVFQLNETLWSVDRLSDILAMLVLSENSAKISDMIEHSALFDKVYEDAVLSEEDMKVSILFTMADSFGVKDDLTDFVVLAFLEERFNLLEDLDTFAEILASDNINVEDIVSLEAFLDLMQEFGFEELRSSIEAFISEHDEFGMTDHTPRVADTDFYIGALEDLDRAYDWFLPFGLLTDYGGSNIQVMPEASNVTIEMPGVDGEVVAGTTYKNRLFSIVAFSVDGMTKQEKEALKSKITDILDSTKHQYKKLTIQSADVVFDVKYTGEAKIEEGPSYVKMTADFLTPPYGKSLFPYELHGSGLVDNTNGDAPLGPIFTIAGEVENPSFKLGAYNFSWEGTVETGTSLVIDFDKLTVYIKDNLGNKKNAMAKFKGEFIKIGAGKSMVLVADENTESHLTVEWSTPVLW